METIKDIDKDVASLHGELNRHDGKWNFHLDRRAKYLVAIVALALFMFLFGVLTRPQVKVFVPEEVLAQQDKSQMFVEKKVSDGKLAALFAYAKKSSPQAGVAIASTTVPRIVSWTPSSVGKRNSDASPVPLVGVYEVPEGFFGAVTLLSDSEAVGVALIDARSATTPTTGKFTIIPPPMEGEHLVRLSFDAVKACRIACDPTDQLCIATNVNYCAPQFDNQAFLTYLPAKAESQPIAGACVTKTFVAGPKYAPQIPEDYTMCERGMWNEDPTASVFQWFFEHKEIPTEDKRAMLADLAPYHSRQSSQPNMTTGSANDLEWKIDYTKGSATDETLCGLKVTVAYACAR